MNISPSINTFFDRSGSNIKADCCEKTSNSFLYFFRNAVGHQRYTLIDNAKPAPISLTVSKITRIISAIFAFLLALPLTLIGLALLQLSKTHKNAYSHLTKIQPEPIVEKKLPLQILQEPKSAPKHPNRHL